MNLQTQELVNRIHHEFLPPLDPDEGKEDEEESWTFVEEDDDLDNFRNSVIFSRAMAAFLAAEDMLEEDQKRFGAASFGLIALSAMLAVAKRVMSPRYQTSRI